MRRTKAFALNVLKLVDELPLRASGRALAGQLARSGPSVGANYRAACRGKSRADFISKLGTVVEEADETVYWLELIMEGELIKAERVHALHQEAKELTAIFTAALRTTRSN